MEEQIEAVQKMQDYIKENIDKNITLSDLAKVSLFSPWYSYRIFLKLINLTPADYSRRIRLSTSALKLRDDKIKIIDVAFEFGYSSVDGYQRAFFKEFGINPKEYAKNPIPICLFIPYGIKYKTFKKENSIMSNVKNVFIQVVERPKRKVIIKRGYKAKDYFAYCEEVSCDIWGILKSIKSISGEPVCLWLPERYRKDNTSEYVQGVEVPTNYDGEVPEGFEIIELTKSKYLMFQGEPFEEENYGKAIEEVWESIKKYDLKTIGYSNDYDNPRIQLEPIGTRGYIELIPIK